MSEALFDYTQKAAHITKANKKIVDWLLSLNSNNRTIKKAHLKWILDAIEKKEFVLTGQGIGVSTDGILIDGQHRLTAIREAGYPPVEIMIVTGLSPDARIYIDQNAKRSTADMLKIVLDKNITTRMAGVLRFHLNFREDKELGFVLDKRKVNLENFVEMMSVHGSNIAEILGSTKGVGRADAIAALFHYGQKFGFDDAFEFANEIGSGANLSLNDPALRVREWMLRHRADAGSIMGYRMMVSACIAHSMAREIQILRPSLSWDELPKRAQPKAVKATEVRAVNTIEQDKALRDDQRRREVA